MKKAVFTLIIIVLLLCLIPFRQQYKDGGSVCYNAVLYDVYDVHSIYFDPVDDEMKFVEGYIIEIFGVQVFNNTTPHIDRFSDSPELFVTTYDTPIGCVEVESGKSINLSEGEQQLIVDAIDDGRWTNGVIKCICDYKFIFSDSELSYNSGSGHFVDYKNQRTLGVSAEDRDRINAILLNEN